MFILALSQTAFMLSSIKILLQCSCETAVSSNSFSKKKKKNQITIAIPTPSTFEKHLDVKVIGVCLYEICFRKEYIYSAKKAKTFAKTISADLCFRNLANFGMVFQGIWIKLMSYLERLKK